MLVEAAGGAAEISWRVDRCVIGADEGDDITGDGGLRARETLFNCGEREIYRAVEQPDRAARASPRPSWAL